MKIDVDKVTKFSFFFFFLKIALLSLDTRAGCFAIIQEFVFPRNPWIGSWPWPGTDCGHFACLILVDGSRQKEPHRT